MLHFDLMDGEECLGLSNEKMNSAFVEERIFVLSPSLDLATVSRKLHFFGLGNRFPNITFSLPTS